jgi:hypothetical protein
MNANTETTAAAAVPLVKADPKSPALKLSGDGAVLIKAGTIFNGATFDIDATVAPPADGYRPGGDYGVMIGGTTASAVLLDRLPSGSSLLGGFHFAPGGNAAARSGGDETPAINPFSLWDLTFRPACPDPRGMAFINPALVPFASVIKPCWADIYLTARDHRAGTSRLGATIADGATCPEAIAPDDDDFDAFDYATAVKVLAHHGKQLLSFEEFIVAAYGVTEKSATAKDPKVTKLDAPRTSRFGLIEATGNLWQWGHDGDPDNPRASLFGGFWWLVVTAGSRLADVAYWLPDDSDDVIGARGRCDHLNPV